MLQALIRSIICYPLVARNNEAGASMPYSLSSMGFTAVKMNALFQNDQQDPLVSQSTLDRGPVYNTPEFKESWFRQPLDHFSDTGHFFEQRYWVSYRHYIPGGPVILLDGGETSGEDRISFLDTGVVNILANATGGLGIVLEHRYYGKSIPVANFSTDSLRWLNNAQAAADSANFMANVKFDELDNDLTAPETPWIYYGGSYAGARAAHMRVLYPDLVYGAIASSAVTHAQIVFPEYNEIIRKAAPGNCASHVTNTINIVDNALSDVHLKHSIKHLFGLHDLEDDIEFVSVLQQPIYTWQAKVWDPKVGSTVFDDFCAFLETKPWRMEAIGDFSLDYATLNYAQWIRKEVVSKCIEADKTIPEVWALPVVKHTYQTLLKHYEMQCFSPSKSRDWEDISLSARWRLWHFQVCTEWGYFRPAPLDPNAPRVISRLITTEHLHSACPKAFPPGKYMTIPQWPNVSVVNDLGGFELEADRLAFIDGEVDPWRPATPHSDYAQSREDTLNRPFKLIPNAVHHYDEYGLRDLEKEPAEIYVVHTEMIQFVQHWLQDRGRS